jgi:caffeoyl-CoA O-methyltransferase
VELQTKSFALTPAIHRYIVEHLDPLDPVQRELIQETAGLGRISLMQVAPEQGAFMELLTRVSGARTAIEVGTFTGYSALCIARGLGPGGRLICLDTSEEWTAIARRYWQKAGVADRIELRLGPAAETLRAIPAEPRFDLAFIDADKAGYSLYYELILERLRPGGLILCDNVLWFGSVADPANQEESTRHIRDFNDRVAADARVEKVMLPIGDGLTIARKR